MLLHAVILEATTVKVGALQTAIEAATMALRVDKVVVAGGSTGDGDNDGGGMQHATQQAEAPNAA